MSAHSTIQTPPTQTARYAKCIEVSKRIRWDIEQDVIKGRRFDFNKKFLPDGLSQIHQLTFLNVDDQRILSQIQGRTYANVFGLVERFIAAKMIEVSAEHVLGDQIALEALIRFTDEELKHQALFRRIEGLVAEGMPEGYRFDAEPNAVAKAVLQASSWAVLALICHIELFTQAHYHQSIESDDQLSELYKDVFLFHWREESQHAILDELEWTRENEKITQLERDQGVDDLISLVVAIDGILQGQAKADVDYFMNLVTRSFTPTEEASLRNGVLTAYRWQYIVSGVQEPRFNELLSGMLTPEQGQKIQRALAPLMG